MAPECVEDYCSDLEPEIRTPYPPIFCLQCTALRIGTPSGGRADRAGGQFLGVERGSERQMKRRRPRCPLGGDKSVH